MNRKDTITIMFGPPGVGKSTICQQVNKMPDCVCLSGDDFITKQGVGRLQQGTWGDHDRIDYLSRMANGAIDAVKTERKVVLADAITTVWMREYLKAQIQATGLLAIAWVLVTRNFTDDEIDELVAARAAVGHPINSRQVFQRFHDQFDPPSGQFLILNNPGPKASEESLIEAIETVLKTIYES